MKTKFYVAYCLERLRDANEECAKIFNNKQAALDWIEKLANGFAGCNCDFKLFELGKELPLTETVEETPQPSKKRRKFS